VNYRRISLAMLIESKRYQTEELPQIYASRVTIAKLERSRRDEE
jgi:hypothetical protein